MGPSWMLCVSERLAIGGAVYVVVLLQLLQLGKVTLVSLLGAVCACVCVCVCVVLCVLVRSCDVIYPITSSGELGMLNMRCSWVLHGYFMFLWELQLVGQFLS